MKKKFFLYYTLLVIIGVSVAGLFISQLSQKLYRQEVEEKLESAAILIKHQINVQSSRNEELDFDAIAKTYAKLLSTKNMSGNNLHTKKARITFINFSGTVIGESETSYSYMENHLERKEIKEAISGITGKDIRYSSTLKIDLLYIALPIETSQVVIRISVPLEQLARINKTIWSYAALGLVAGFLLTSLLALKLSSKIVKPIKELISISKDMHGGDYSKRSVIKSEDELGILSKTYNDMADKLEETVSDLKTRNIRVNTIINSMTDGIIAVDNKCKVILINQNACLLFKIESSYNIIGTNLIETIRNHQINSMIIQTIDSGTTLLNEIILGAHDERILRVQTIPIKSEDSKSIITGGIVTIQDITNIKRLEKIRTEFVSNVTHELKTPLTSIRGFIETLRNGAINDPEVTDKFLDIIDIEAERLYILINDILQLSEIETMQKDVNIKTYEFSSIIKEILPILEESAKRKGITLLYEIDDELEITTNKDRVKQMLINLIDNGIKYNIQNGNIFIKAFKDKGKTIISIKDTGIGIAEEHIPRIFERFYRVDKGRSRNMGGTGLGLSIVKHIVNLYNGDLQVFSSPGEGTEFVIQLPI